MWLQCHIHLVELSGIHLGYNKLVLASLCYRLKNRAVGETTPYDWVVQFFEGRPPLLYVGSRVNPFIWWYGKIDLIWVHSVPNTNQHRVHLPLISFLYLVIS